ncbi:MAG: hypothetical protein QXH24_04795 [Candidatus Bathyarchaeia archaeon]
MRGKETRKNIWKELEIGFGGRKKLMVLFHLASNPEKVFTKYAIAKATGLRTPSVDRRLKTLVEISWG